jgi:hypothetical protein
LILNDKSKVALAGSEASPWPAVLRLDKILAALFPSISSSPVRVELDKVTSVKHESQQ